MNPFRIKVGWVPTDLAWLNETKAFFWLGKVLIFDSFDSFQKKINSVHLYQADKRFFEIC